MSKARMVMKRDELIDRQTSFAIEGLERVVIDHSHVEGGSEKERRDRLSAIRELIELLIFDPEALEVLTLLVDHVGQRKLLNGGQGYIKIRGMLIDLLGTLSKNPRAAAALYAQLEQVQPPKTKDGEIGSRTNPDLTAGRDGGIIDRLRETTTLDEWNQVFNTYVNRRQ